METHHHRSGTLKQSNKSHKGGAHSSKRALNKALHGRVEKASPSAFSSSGPTTKKGAKGTWAETHLNIRHSDRMNHAKQVINARKEAAAVARRLGNGNNTIGVPKSIGIIGLSSFVRPEAIAAQLLCSADDVIIPNSNWHQVGTPIAAVFSKFRQRISITVPPRPGQIRYDGAENLQSSSSGSTPYSSSSSSLLESTEPFVYEVTHTMTACSGVDVLLLVADMSHGMDACIDEEGDLILTALKATGVPTLLGVITGLDVHPVSKHNDLRKHASRLFHTEFGADNVKIIEAGNDPYRSLLKLAEEESVGGQTNSSLTLVKLQNTATVSTGTLTLVRAVCDANPRSITWRSQRSYLTAMESSWSPYEDQLPLGTNGSASTTENNQTTTEDGTPLHHVGTLTVSGYLRGRPLNVNQLICIPNVGTYQIEGITRPLHHPLQNMGSHRSRASKKKNVKTDTTSSSTTAKSNNLSTTKPSALSLEGISEIAQSFADNILTIPWTELTPNDIDPSGTVINPDNKYHLPLMIALGPYAYCVRTVDVSEYYDSTGKTDSSNNGTLTTNNLSSDTDNPPNDGNDDEILAVPNDQIQETLEHLNPVDPLEGEQAWALQNEGTDTNLDEGDDDDNDDDDDDDQDGLAPFIDKSGKVDMYAATHGLDPNDPEYELKKNQAIQLMRDNELTERHRLQQRRRRMKLKKQGLLGDDEDDEEEGDESNNQQHVNRNVIEYDGIATNDPFDKNDEFGMDDTGTVTDMAPTPSEVANRRASALKIAQSESEDQELFPDEIDTPMEQIARERFGRYRGLKSFRTSPWHPQESLPPDYSHIFALSHFYRTQRRILGENELAERALLSLENERMSMEKMEKKEIHQNITAKKAAARNAASGTDNQSVLTDTMNDDSNMTTATTVLTKSSSMFRSTGGGTANTSSDIFIPSDLSTILGSGWVSPGQYITIHLNNVSKDAIDDLYSYYGHSSFSFTIWGLLRHENRTSVMHYNITRIPTYSLPLKSREHLEFYVGSHRLFDARPVFSSGGSQLSDRTKMDRYVRPNTNAIATVYGPIIYSPCPVLIFKRIPTNVIEQQLAQGSNVSSNVISSSASSSASTVITTTNVASTVFMQDHESLESLYPSPDRLSSEKAGRTTRLVLVATGTVIGSDPDKIILKRTILSGFPIKVKKRFAMVKYMFFNPDDINYFKPVELYTKYGLVGHITASVGTHGSMKCRFDQPITQADTVCMPLYKRIYPRWGNAYKTLFTSAGYHLEQGKLVMGETTMNNPHTDNDEENDGAEDDI